MNADPFAIVPVRCAGEDVELIRIRAQLAKLRTDVQTLKAGEAKDQALTALEQLALWVALAMREERK